MTHVIDSWVWIEYFRGSLANVTARNAIESGECATSVITIAEISDAHHRDQEPRLAENLAFLKAKTRVLNLTPAIAEAAAATKWAQRAEGRAMGLADALIYETARAYDLAVLTGDEGFAGLEGVEFVGAEK
jgi:predicted nucleic acid-binding protein